MLFERLVIGWAQDAAMAAVSRRVKVGWEAIWGILQRAVRRGLERRELGKAHLVGCGRDVVSSPTQLRDPS